MLELEKGTQLADRYTLVRRLGGDSLAHSWLAKDRLTNASVALKITAGDAQSTKRLRAEWKTSIRFMHAHVVRAFEFHSEPDAAFFSQQFIDGPDARVLTGLPVEDVLGPIGLITQALAYLHSKDLVHRDLKASNVLLDANGAPYLSDFGVSGASGQVHSGGSLIAQSPQSLDGSAATSSDDIFALGGLIYELLSGQSPWSVDAIEEQIRHSAPPPLRMADGSELPAEVVALVVQMLAKDAVTRPSADEVGERLEASGFMPRTASIRGVVRPLPETEIIELVEAIWHRPAEKAMAVGAVAESDSGLGRNTVLLSLLALVAILVAVIFVLPNSLSDRSIDNKRVQTFTIDEFLGPEVIRGDGDAARPSVYVDPDVRRRVKGDISAPTRKLADDDDITFSENDAYYSGLDKEGRARFMAEATLGELLSAFEVLDLRGAGRWAPREYRAARDFYKDGDAAYLKKDFAHAEELYLAALTVLNPLYPLIEPAFDNAYAKGEEAFAVGERLGAIRWYELAVAVTPSHAGAQAGYKRAKNLEAVLHLVDQGIEYEEDLELDAAQKSFEQAVALDAVWRPAIDGLLRVEKTRTKMQFDMRMSEGFVAIAVGDYLAARAAFRAAQKLIPDSSEPADGLLQVDQGMRLADISTLEQEAQALERDEHWDAVISTYEEILKVDNTLMFASDGLQKAREMSALHARLDKLVEEPDKLSAPSQMQRATSLVVDIATRPKIGSRLGSQRDELLRLLKRAATPLKVSLLSDNVTAVSIYKVGRLGNFLRRELDLRPGTYVAVGSRPGFRDVRLEFRVAPEIEIEPVIVQCEERI
jgi:serine/threonine protein kinase/tetratricopeptide (TPR) repeat protein